MERPVGFVAADECCSDMLVIYNERVSVSRPTVRVGAEAGHEESMVGCDSHAEGIRPVTNVFWAVIESCVL